MEQVGDIKLGPCSESEVADLFRYVKRTCQQGYHVMLKKTIRGEYYISVPIHNVDSLFVTPLLSNKFYFHDLSVSDDLACITFDVETDLYISNSDEEGCVLTKFDCDNLLYEILLYPEEQSPIKSAKQCFVCFG